MKCQYCQEKEGKYKQKNGKMCCEPYPAQCPEVRRKNSEKTSKRLKEEYKEGKRVSYFIQLNDGSIWKGRHHSEKTKQKLRGFKRKMNDKFKLNRSNEMHKRYASGWEAKAGRCKKIDYISPIAGKIKVDGTWELKVCTYLDKNNYIWIRNKKRFEYIDNLNKHRTYCPDFYLKNENLYIEVKGYITDLDKIKWNQFTEKLEIWDKKVLIEKKIL